MTEKTFNKWFSGILMGLMVVTIGITTVFKLQEPEARTLLILVAALGSVMGVASSVLSANGIIWTFLFGLLDIACCLVVDADNGIWGDFSMHLFYLLPMQIIGIWQWRKRGDCASQAARIFMGFPSVSRRSWECLSWMTSSRRRSSIRRRTETICL